VRGGEWEQLPAATTLVTELLRGRSLATLLDAERRLGLDDVERIIVPLCEAVEEAHAQGIIHRDLKPSNVFLERLRDGAEVVKVLDFGIAKLLSRRGDVPAPVDLSKWEDVVQATKQRRDWRLVPAFAA
jgi:serine/threonine protein kinase